MSTCETVNRIVPPIIGTPRATGVIGDVSHVHQV